ncbi:Hypp1014 [Branchiostoma lanceolatum]|uniref:Hypp1014 protein n=1 Tax=Branchiostoma lanceolatum TaxID=7740 RepID=A0A8K0EIY2_BRALA|nr:Hypp1014 [Branchiostoma lanceolatum]
MQNSHWEMAPSVQYTGDAQSGSHDSYALQGVEMKLSPTIAPTNKVCLPVQYQNSHSKTTAVLAEANYDFSVERRVLGMDGKDSSERS